MEACIGARFCHSRRRLFTQPGSIATIVHRHRPLPPKQFTSRGWLRIRLTANQRDCRPHRTLSARLAVTLRSLAPPFTKLIENAVGLPRSTSGPAQCSAEAGSSSHSDLQGPHTSTSPVHSPALCHAGYEPVHFRSAGSRPVSRSNTCCVDCFLLVRTAAQRSGSKPVLRQVSLARLALPAGQRWDTDVSIHIAWRE